MAALGASTIGCGSSGGRGLVSVSGTVGGLPFDAVGAVSGPDNTGNTTLIILTSFADACGAVTSLRVPGGGDVLELGVAGPLTAGMHPASPVYESWTSACAPSDFHATGGTLDITSVDGDALTATLNATLASGPSTGSIEGTFTTTPCPAFASQAFYMGSFTCP